MNKEDKKSLHKEVLQKIQKGDIHMKPKIHFALQSVALASGIILLAGFILYLISFIIFTLRVNGILLLPAFGFRGFGILLTSLPWILITVVLILIVVLEILSRHFAFVYRRPILYSIVGIVLLVFAGGILVDQTSLHNRALQISHEKGLPIGGPLYRRYGDMPFRGGLIGTIVEIKESSLVVEDTDGEKITVATSSARARFSVSNLEVGDTIMVIGDLKDDSDMIDAFGIRKLDESFVGLPGRYRQMFQTHRGGVQLPESNQK